MTFKFGLIFLQLYCLITITKCMEYTKFDISELPPNTVYKTRTLPEMQPQTNYSDGDPALADGSSTQSPAKQTYTLAKDFAAELRLLVHKIIKTFVKIGQSQEGQTTLSHIYNEFYAISSNEVSAQTLKLIMNALFEIMQNENAKSVIFEIGTTMQYLFQANLAEWSFIFPFLYDLNQNPQLIKIVESGVAELHYINQNENRKLAAGFLFDELFGALAISDTTVANAAITDATDDKMVPVGGPLSATAATAATESPTQAAGINRFLKRSKSTPSFKIDTTNN